MNSDKMRENADAATELLKALASRNRLLILCQLIGGERSVGELAKRLELRGTVVSQHLGLLRRDGLVATARQSIIHFRARRPAGCLRRSMTSIVRHDPGFCRSRRLSA